MNKRTLLIFVSIILIAASVFGIIAAGVGVGELSDIMRFKKAQKADILDFVYVLDERVLELREAEKDRSEEEKEYAEAVVTDKVGGEQLTQGEQQYNSGANQIAQGQAQYDAAMQQYNEKLAEYQAAEKQLNAAEEQLNDARAQRNAGQAQLDAAAEDYQKAKPIYDLLQTNTGALVSQILAQSGYTSLEELKADVKAYEDGLARVAEADRQIAAAERQIDDGRAQLAAAKVQLDDGKKQLDAAKAQLDSSKAQLASAKNELAAGQERLNDNVDKMNELKDSLLKQDDAESAVKSGIALLMENEGIAERVEDESDYEAVLKAAENYAEEDADKLNIELDVRQNLYNTLRIVSVIGLLAGIVGVLAALKPNRQRIMTAAAGTVLSAVGAIGVNIYGMSNGYRSFAYALEDGSCSGTLQMTALLVLLAAAIIAAIVALVCSRAYNGMLTGKIEFALHRPRPEQESAPLNGAEAEPEDDDDDEDYAPRRKKEKKPRKAAPEREDTAPQSIDELTAETARLNAEAERLEAQKRSAEYEKARKEYEEARRRFEEARRMSDNERE